MAATPSSLNKIQQLQLIHPRLATTLATLATLVYKHLN